MAPDLTDRQVEVEAMMARLGYERYWAQISKAREKGDYAVRTDTGRMLLRAMVWRVADWIRRWLKEAKKARGTNAGWKGISAIDPLEQCGPDVAALIACKMFIDQISLPRSNASLTMGVGHRIEDELCFREIRRRAPKLFRRVMRQTERSGYEHRRTVMLLMGDRSEKLEVKRLERYTVARVGMVACEAVFQASGMFERVVRFNTTKLKDEVSIRASAEVLQWVERSEREHEMLHPFYMPTVDPPRDWVGLTGGGYHTDVVLRRPLVKFHRWRHVDIAHDEDYQAAAEACNELQRVAWETNRLVTECAQTLWHSGVQAADLPPREPKPIPSKPLDIAENDDARKQWRRAAACTYRENIEQRGRRVGVTRTLFVARTYQCGREPFYFPHYSDFRGRLYARPLFLDPQGADLARGSLRFAQGVPLGEHGLFWLGIHGANCFGVDKLTLEDRFAWVRDHQREIEQVDRDPIEGRVFWEQADKPWSFLAFCDEWVDAVRGGPDYPSHLPCHVDGTNNGLQIYSMLMRDEHGAEITNVVPSDAPRDAYQDVADEATRRLRQVAGPGYVSNLVPWKDLTAVQARQLEQQLARRLLHLVGDRLPREAVKRTTMATPYGLTRWSGESYVREWLDEVFPDEWELTYKLRRLMGPIVWYSMDAQLAGARRAMDWLRGIARLAAKEGKDLRWSSPTGFRVIQDYRKQIHRVVKTSMGTAIRKKPRTITLRLDSDDLSPGAQADGFPPNYVHSLDGACVQRIVPSLRAVGIPAFSTVHDGFACHAAHVGLMGAVVRKVYAEVFVQDQLRILKEQIEEHTGLELPDPPEYGALDPRCIRESRYAFT